MNWSRRDLAALDGLEPHEADGFQLAQRARDVRLGAACQRGQFGDRLRFLVTNYGQKIAVLRRQKTQQRLDRVETQAPGTLRRFLFPSGNSPHLLAQRRVALNLDVLHGLSRLSFTNWPRWGCVINRNNSSYLAGCSRARSPMRLLSSLAITSRSVNAGLIWVTNRFASAARSALPCAMSMSQRKFHPCCTFRLVSRSVTLPASTRRPPVSSSRATPSARSRARYDSPRCSAR